MASSSSSPFDDDDEPARPAPMRRAKRPWWRYSLVTLALSLFVLAWARELLNLSLRVTWVGVLAVFTTWFLMAELVPKQISETGGLVAWFGRLTYSFARNVVDVVKSPVVLRIALGLVLGIMWYLVLSVWMI